MQQILLQLTLAGAFGAFVGLLFHLTRRKSQLRAYTSSLVGLVAGFTAYLIFFFLAHITGAPAWLLPLLVLLQVWLWLGPLGPKRWQVEKNSGKPR